MRLFLHRTSNQAAEARRGYNVMGDTRGVFGDQFSGERFQEITVNLCDGITLQTRELDYIKHTLLPRLNDNGRLVLQS